MNHLLIRSDENISMWYIRTNLLFYQLSEVVILYWWWQSCDTESGCLISCAKFHLGDSVPQIWPSASKCWRWIPRSLILFILEGPIQFLKHDSWLSVKYPGKPIPISLLHALHTPACDIFTHYWVPLSTLASRHLEKIGFPPRPFQHSESTELTYSAVRSYFSLPSMSVSRPSNVTPIKVDNLRQAANSCEPICLPPARSQIKITRSLPP